VIELAAAAVVEVAANAFAALKVMTKDLRKCISRYIPPRMGKVKSIEECLLKNLRRSGFL
jgi:hypothetical protein